MLSAALQRNAKHEARLSNISRPILLLRRVRVESLILRFAQNDIVATLVVEQVFLCTDTCNYVDGGITKIVTMAEAYVPLISSGIAGPLGVLHLPRLVAEGLAGGIGKTCLRLSRRRQRFRRDDARRTRTRRTGGARLHQAKQADLSAVRGVGKEEREVAKSRRDRKAQRSGARLQS